MRLRQWAWVEMEGLSHGFESMGLRERGGMERTLKTERVRCVLAFFFLLNRVKRCFLSCVLTFKKKKKSVLAWIKSNQGCFGPFRTKSKKKKKKKQTKQNLQQTRVHPRRWPHVASMRVRWGAPMLPSWKIVASYTLPFFSPFHFSYWDLLSLGKLSYTLIKPVHYCGTCNFSLRSRYNFDHLHALHNLHKVLLVHMSSISSSILRVCRSRTLIFPCLVLSYHDMISLLQFCNLCWCRKQFNI